MKINSQTLLDVPITITNSQLVIPQVESLLQKKSQIQIVTPNPEHLVQAQGDPDFLRVLQKADLSIPDGVGVVLGVKLQSFKEKLKTYFSSHHLIKNDFLIERITGVDCLYLLCKWGTSQNYKIGFIGSNKKIGEMAIQNIYQKICQEKIQINKNQMIYLGFHLDIKNTSEKENIKIIDDIKKSGVNILFVAYGAPYQEIWIAKYLPELKSVKIAMGVGGAFDFWAGVSPRSPKFLQNLGLEWLYRLIQEPWRWKRQLRLIQYVLIILRETFIPQ